MSADIVLTEETLRYISLFEAMTKTNVIDCMETEDKLVYVVEKGQGNTAVGKKGEHVSSPSSTTSRSPSPWWMRTETITGPESSSSR